jgi:hypothetical protein
MNEDDLANLIWARGYCGVLEVMRDRRPLTEEEQADLKEVHDISDSHSEHQNRIASELLVAQISEKTADWISPTNQV